MLNTELDYTNNNLIFNYLNLKKYLYQLYTQNIDNVNILLLISLEKEYYEGDNLKRIIKDLKNLSNNLITDFDILDENGKPTGKKTEKVKFKVNKIQFILGDVLNKHRWIYRYNEQYMLDNNLTEEEQIPENIKQEIEIKAYEAGKQQGKDWFKNHAIDAINEVLLDSNISLKTLDSRLRGNDSSYQSNVHLCKNDSSSQSSICHSREGGNPEKPSNLKKNSTKLIDKDFQLTSGITTIFEGNNELPPLEYICYDYWLNYPKYKIIEKALNEVINIKDSVVDRAYDYEVKYYVERLNGRNENQKFLNMFFKYSKIYLIDETIASVLMHQDIPNNFEFYWFGTEPKHILAFKGKKGQSNEIIKNYINNELYGITNVNHTTIKIKY